MKSQTTIVAKRFIINFCCIFLLVATGVIAQAQTNPTAQNLTYSQNFGTTTFTVAPTGMATWTVASSSKGSQSSAESSTPNGDASITAATTTQTTGGCYGYSTSSNGRFYIQTSSDTANGTNQLAISIEATHMEDIRISYDVEMISAQAKTIGVVLQYRIGTTGSWTTISESAYAHNSSNRSAGQIDNFIELNLPEIANNEDVVQLRWATWCGSEVGNYSGIGIDNISITGTDKLQFGPIYTCVEKEITHFFSGTSIGDTIVASIVLPQGVTAIDSANLFSDTTNVVVDTSDLYNPTYTFIAPATSFTLSYYVKADCETFEASTNNEVVTIYDTINGVLNNTANDTILIYSPWIIFDNSSSTNLTYNNAFIDSNYTRTLVYKNTGQAFTGELLFLDTIPNFNSAAIQFVSAVIDTVTSGTANIISSTINDSVVQLRIQLTNFTNNSSLFIEEVIKLIDCPDETNNRTYFSAFYGCADDTLCAEAQTTVFWATTNEDANDKPVLLYTLLTKGYPDCWKDEQERIIKINNTGLSAASEVQLWFRKDSSPLYITENSLDSFEIYHFDGVTKTAIPYSDTIISGEYWITTLEPLAAGDSLFFRYFEIINCIDSSNYDDFFNNTIAMHDFFPYVNLIHPCNPTPAGLQQRIDANPLNQYGWVSWQHESKLQQTFYNYINTMNGGDSANFEVSSSNLVLTGISPTYGNPGFIFNIPNSEILIELQLDPALGLVPDSLYLFGNIGGIPTAIYPDSIEYFLGLDSLIGGGDKIIAHFAIPDTFYYAVTQPYWSAYKYKPKPYFNEFFSSFKVKFRLRAYCEYMTGAPSAIVQRFFFVPDKLCTPDCKLPLAKVEDAINVHCPGCLFPGWNISSFDIQRTNFGFADDNNNNFPDSFPLQPADTNLVKIKNVMLRDTLECTLTANTSDGEDLLMFYNIGVDYKYAQLLLQNSRMGNLQFLGATGTFTDSNGVHNFTVPSYAGNLLDTNFYLDLSIDSLKIYSGDTSLTQFWIGNDLTIRPTFAVVENFTNPYFNIEDINAFLYMAGTPFTGVMTKPDAFNYEIDTLEAMSDSLRSELAFWCTGYGGSYGAIGADYTLPTPYLAHYAYYISNYHPCKNILQYAMNTEVGSTVLPYGGNDQAAWNSFSYELRNLWMLDSIQVTYPNGFVLDSVIILNTQLTSDGLGGNTGYGCSPWSPTSFHDYDLQLDAIIDTTSATIYPARNLTELTAEACLGLTAPNLRGWDETKRYRILFILKNTDCGLPQSYQASGYPITTYWSDFPTATNGDTTIVQTVNGEFNKPDAKLITSLNTLTQDAPNSNLIFNMTVDAEQTVVPVSTDTVTHAIAENTFLIINSPSNNVVIDSIVSSVSPYNRIYALNEINNDSLYGLGMVGDYWGAANFNVFAHYNCANIDVSDSILVYFGWNCNGYPDSLQPLNSVCYLDSVWIPFNIIKPGLQALLSVQDTVAICDTLHYDVKLTATGAGRLDSVNVWMPTSSTFSFLSGSGQIVYNGDTIVTPTGVDTLLFALSTDGLLPDFEQDTAHFLFDILPNCGFYTSSDEVKVFVTATNYCGNRLDTIFLGKRPEFIDLPEQDSLLVEILGDTVLGCNDATISIDVTNLGANPTGSANTITVDLPTGFTWASGDSASVVNGQTYTFDINGGITNLSTQTIEFVTADTVGNGVYNIIVNSWLAQEVICGTDTCSFIQSGAASTDTVQITIINRDLLLDSTFVVASCYGDSTGSIDITVTGGTTPYTYSWINSSSVSYGTSQDLTNLPADTYIVTVTDSANCNFTDSITVTSAGATISGAGSICATGSQPITITLTGTAPWDIVYNDGMNNITVTGITSSPYVFSAISVGNYTLVSVNGTTCVSDTAKITNKGGCGTCGSALASYTWGSAPATGFYKATNDIYVTDTVTITNVILTMAEGKFIYISNGASLTLEHCHLYACTNMWLGIIVEPGGELIITDGTFIEDAEIAVYISTPDSSTTLAIDNAIFNRNLDAVFIDDFQSTSATPYSNFSISNAVFTCRTIPYSSTWPTVATLQTLTSANTLDEHYTMGGYATTALKAPFSSDTSSSGITLLTVGTLSGGTYYEMLIDGNNGSNTFNLFDNLLYGINANSSNFTCKNNAFQYIIEETSLLDGMAINATDAGVGYTTDNRIKVIDDGAGGTNYFYDCTIGVNIDNYRDITVSNTDIRSTQMPVSSTPPEGKGGIYINTPNCTQVTVDNNTITNIRNGIKFFADAVSDTVGGTYYTNAQSIHNVNITSNTIRANYSGVTLTNEYVIVGIVADNLITYTDYFVTFPTSEPINVIDNHLYDVHSGISMNNWIYLYNNFGPTAYEMGNRAIAQDNYILLRARTYPSSGLGQAGVYHTGNSSNYIINNNVQGFGINSSVWAGIYSDNLSIGTYLNTTKVECNLTENIAIGNYFINDHGAISYKNNEIKTSALGLLLDNSIIGNQGNSTYASDNEWTGSYPSGTYTVFTTNYSDPNNSKLFIQNTGSYNPATVGNGCGTGDTPPATYTYAYGNGLDSAANASTLSCDALPTGKLVGNGSEYDLFSNNADVNRLEQLVTENGMDYGIFPTEQYINAQHRVYRWLNILPQLKDSSTILLNFYNAKTNHNIGRLAEIENSLALGKLNKAEALLNTITPNNDIEANHQKYYTAYIHFKKKSCNATDSTALWQLVTGCTSSDGNIIHQARSLFNLLYQKDYTIYFDDCSDAVIGAKTNRLTTINTQQNRQEQFAVYPNPSNGELWIKPEKGLFDQCKVIIYDIAGKIVFEKNMLINNETKITPNLKQGTYFIHIIPNNNLIKSFKDKITIIE